MIKIKLDIECTPAEAREFMGLPDLQPIQAKLLAEMEQRLREAANQMTPEAIIRRWFDTFPIAAEQMWQSFEKALKRDQTED